jgi:hypothetical protein
MYQVGHPTREKPRTIEEVESENQKSNVSRSVDRYDLWGDHRARTDPHSFSDEKPATELYLSGEPQGKHHPVYSLLRGVV